MAKTAAPKQRAATDVLSLKVTLRNIRPPIWRRIVMSGGMTLRDLHMAIQATMGWEDSHLHAFDVAGQQYGDRATTDDVVDEARLRLDEMKKSGISRFRYTYDFGDDWDHDVLIEKAPPASRITAYPACVAGKRNCPPEDCGGPWGYAELVQVLADPADPRFEEQREWIGEDFDPEDFSVPYADATLAAAFRRK